MFYLMVRNTFLTCFAPFDLEDGSCMNSCHDAAAFFDSMEHQIRRLERALSEDSVTLQWCTQALNLLKKLHSEFLLLFQSIKLSVSWTEVSTLFDDYMNESLNILELCNLLKSATTEMDRYRIKIDIFVKCLCSEECVGEIQCPDRKKKHIHTLDWRRFEGFKHRKCKAKNVSCAIKIAIIMISSILFSAVLCPIPVKTETEMCCQHQKTKSFVDSVYDLARCFNNKIQLSGGHLSVEVLEYEMMYSAVMGAKKQPEQKAQGDGDKWERRKVAIKQKSAALKVGLEGFESELSIVFDEVLKGRSKLLQKIISSST